MSTDTRTIGELAGSAFQVQNACNLSGVVLAFGQVLSRLWVIATTEGWSNTDDINNHPISKLYADKIASLAGIQGGGVKEYAAAYAACVKLHGSEPETP